MAIKDANRVKGSIFDVARIDALSDSPCHILFVSERTLSILANIAQGEVNWYARYTKAHLGGGLVDSVEEGDPEAAIVDDVARNFGLEVTSVNCDIFPILENLVAATQEISTKLASIDATLQGINATLTDIGTSQPNATYFDDLEETINEVAKILGAVGVVLT